MVPSFIEGSAPASTVDVTAPEYPAATTGVPSIEDPSGAISRAGHGVVVETFRRATSPFLKGRMLTTFAVSALEAAVPKAAWVGSTRTTRSGGDPLSWPSIVQLS